MNYKDRNWQSFQLFMLTFVLVFAVTIQSSYAQNCYISDQSDYICEGDAIDVTAGVGAAAPPLPPVGAPTLPVDETQLLLDYTADVATYMQCQTDLDGLADALADAKVAEGQALAQLESDQAILDARIADTQAAQALYDQAVIDREWWWNNQPVADALVVQRQNDLAAAEATLLAEQAAPPTLAATLAAAQALNDPNLAAQAAALATLTAEQAALALIDPVTDPVAWAAQEINVINAQGVYDAATLDVSNTQPPVDAAQAAVDNQPAVIAAAQAAYDQAVIDLQDAQDTAALNSWSYTQALAVEAAALSDLQDAQAAQAAALAARNASWNAWDDAKDASQAAADAIDTLVDSCA